MTGVNFSAATMWILYLGLIAMAPRNGEGTLFQLPRGHQPGPFYNRQAANLVSKPWEDIWGCAENDDYIRDVPQPFLDEIRRPNVRGASPAAGAHGQQAAAGRLAPPVPRGKPKPNTDDLARRSPRILHADAAKRNDFPYVVSLVNTNVPREGARAPDGGSQTGRRVCAGALIDSRHVVTAASCVSGATPDALEVKVNVIDITDPRDGIRVEVDSILSHPEFRRAWNMYWNDIALIRLGGDLNLSGAGGVKAVCPPVQQHTRWLHRRIGQRGMVASWGAAEYGGPTVSTLRYGEFQAVPTIACQVLGMTLLRPIPASQVICAHGDGGVVRALCTGDSGAPYVVLDHDTGLPTLVGIATVPPNEDCLEYQVTLFTRLDNYIDWIRDSISSAKNWS